MHATDNDVDVKNSRIQYSISESDDSQYSHSGEEYRASSLFAITSNGEIYTRNVPIDREKTPILSFTVVASDYGNPSFSAFANVVVRVQDINDHSPVWIFPQSSKSVIVRVNMSSHATVGKEVAHLKAVDSDTGPNGEIEYSIIKGNEHEYFALDKVSGTLYLAKPLAQSSKLSVVESNATDFSNEGEFFPQSFILALKASDKGKTPRSNTTILKVDIIQNQEVERSFSHLIQFRGIEKQIGNLPFRHGFGIIGDRDLMIITAMIVVALVISFLLIAAIVFLRCRQPNRHERGVLEYRNNQSGGLLKRFEILNCLSGVEAPTENKDRQTATLLLSDTERNPNFDEAIQSQHYGLNDGMFFFR